MSRSMDLFRPLPDTLCLGANAPSAFSCTTCIKHMSTLNESVYTDLGIYAYHIRDEQAVITFIPASIYNKRRKNPQGIAGPVATTVSRDRALAHLDEKLHESVYN